MGYRSQQSIQSILATSGAQISSQAANFNAAFSTTSDRHLYLVTAPAVIATLPTAAAGDVGKSIGFKARSTPSDPLTHQWNVIVQTSGGQIIDSSGITRTVQVLDDEVWFMWDGAKWARSGIGQFGISTLAASNVLTVPFATTGTNFATGASPVTAQILTLDPNGSGLRFDFSAAAVVAANGARVMFASLACNNQELAPLIAGIGGGNICKTNGTTHANTTPQHIGFSAYISSTIFTPVFNANFTWPLIFTVRMWCDGNSLQIDPTNAGLGLHAGLTIETVYAGK